MCTETWLSLTESEDCCCLCTNGYYKLELSGRSALQIYLLTYKCAASKITYRVRLYCSLTRQPSKRVTGEPFIVKEVVAVDMFPHTEHYELVILLERNGSDSTLDRN